MCDEFMIELTLTCLRLFFKPLPTTKPKRRIPNTSQTEICKCFYEMTYQYLVLLLPVIHVERIRYVWSNVKKYYFRAALVTKFKSVHFYCRSGPNSTRTVLVLIIFLAYNFHNFMTNFHSNLSLSIQYIYI